MTSKPPDFYRKQAKPQRKAYFSMPFSDVAKEGNGGKGGPPRAMENNKLRSIPREQNKSPIKEQPLFPRGPSPCNPTKISELL